ncbi:MAG: flavin-containing monooxygenase [Burkholderiaceae bacterium]
MTNTPRPHQTVIIGAGMSGICMAISLKRAGLHNFVILEKSDQAGGTWHENRYPGAQCDVQSHLYAFSFAPNPDWTRRYAGSAEIQAYLQNLIRQFDLTGHLQLNTAVKTARFDEADGLWTLVTGDGRILMSQAIALSQAPLHEPRWPQIPGLDSFGGKLIHTAKWPETHSLRGRKVAVIGNAASAVQLVPPVARQAAELTVFQRSANWIMPRGDRLFTGLERQLLRRPIPARAYRWFLAARYESNRLGFTPHSAASRFAAKQAQSHLTRQVSDPALRQTLTPDYPLGCKRILVTDDYYPALQRPNVRLETRPISAASQTGLILTTGESLEFDDIICATGFDIGGSLARIDITGRAGASLARQQADKPAALHGMTVPDFPNLFLLLGPNTATGHTSTLLYIEAQTGYVVQCLQELNRRARKALVVREAVYQAHNKALQDRLRETVWGADCTSWYKSTDGHNGTIYPGFTPQYRRAVKRPDFSQFEFL